MSQSALRIQNTHFDWSDVAYWNVPFYIRSNFVYADTFSGITGNPQYDIQTPVLSPVISTKLAVVGFTSTL